MLIFMKTLAASCSLAPNGPIDEPGGEETDLRGYFIDVGQADSALVTCDGHSMLIDGGNAADSDLIYEYTGTAFDGESYSEVTPPLKAGAYNLRISADPADSVIGETNIAFTIDKAPLTMRADNKSVNRGNPQPAYTYSLSGLKGGDARGDVISADPALASPDYKDVVGSYPILIHNASLTSGVDEKGENYEPVYVSGTLTVRSGGSGSSGGTASGGGSAGGSESEEQDETQTAAGTTRPAASFSDVSCSDWYFGDVSFVVEKGLFNGVSDSEFSPGTSMTRAMLATVLHRLAGSPQAAGGAAFSDVPAGQWFSEAVAWASANGIVNGYSAELFGANDDVTREQIAVLFYRYAGLKGYDVSLTADISAFADAGSVSDWAREAVAWANAAGLISGRSATSLAPLESATRAEVAAIMRRFTEYAENQAL